jgi:hypothetical protein
VPSAETAGDSQTLGDKARLSGYALLAADPQQANNWGVQARPALAVAIGDSLGTGSVAFQSHNPP